MNDDTTSDAFDLAMDYRLIAGELFTALLDTVSTNGCKCVLEPVVSEWYEGMSEMDSISDRMRYAVDNPFPNIEDPIRHVCKACSAMEAYQQIVGEEAVLLEKRKFLSDPEVMPPDIREILEDELGHLDSEQVMSAFMGMTTDESVIQAIERAQERTSQYLRDNDNTTD